MLREKERGEEDRRVELSGEERRLGIRRGDESREERRREENGM